MAVFNEFKCTMCGQCCANQDLIQMTTYELYSLAQHLNMSPVEFFDRYCTVGATSQNPAVHIYLKTTDMRCPFLNGKMCSVHEGRPFACRAYPSRQLRTGSGEMKAFVRNKYPMLEQTCSLFDLDDTDELIGDADLLTRQTIAYVVDEIYFNSILPETVDLSVPYEVTGAFLTDEMTGQATAAHLVDPARSTLNGPVTGMIAMTLQALTWGCRISFARNPSKLTIESEERIGEFLLAQTDSASVDALRALVESNRMDRGRAFAAPLPGGKALISAVYGSSTDRVAIGLQIEVEAAKLAIMTGEGKRPLVVFFLPEDGSSSRAVGLAINTQ